MTDRSYAHPWINDECREALQRKHSARNTDNYARMRDACSETFLCAYQAFVATTRDTLRSLGAGSKGWWKTANALLTKSRTQENIPALQRQDGSWAMTPEERAAELASTFHKKSQLPPPSENQYSAPPGEPREQQQGFLRVRVRTVRKLLKKLDENTATGPDRLPARILKRCADELALPVTLLARQLLSEGRWPKCWRTHWAHALHKRKSRADARNYRGVHLTAQLSKVVERAVGLVVTPWAESKDVYGPNQFAYGKGKGDKDTLTVNVCNWLLLMEQGHAVGLFCSDVSGAFDRVDSEKLRQKLLNSGLHVQVVELLASWLEDRVCQVVVGGERSAEQLLANSVFQGTVLGPPLWNLFCESARYSVNFKRFVETVFADDFNCWKAYKVKHDNVSEDQASALHDLRGAQKELHQWGEANRVVFDPSKESFHLLHRRFHHGEDFKILGVAFDTGLLMHKAAREVATEGGWRLQTLLRVRRFFTTPELFGLYKAQILSYMESGTPALFHAAPSVLDRVDRVQRRFLRELDHSEESALRDFRLAPLNARRDMAMLGALHKVTLGTAPAQLRLLFPPLGAPPTVPYKWQVRLRSLRALHDRQLSTAATPFSTDTFGRSLFGLVNLYNWLPQHLVECTSVKLFQRNPEF